MSGDNSKKTRRLPGVHAARLAAVAAVQSYHNYRIPETRKLMEDAFDTYEKAVERRFLRRNRSVTNIPTENVS